ncbi:hypothetical protein BKH44_03000 [Helicobacter sp. 13S00477-4]|nr:hypothetical protein BKH44_03000 [Helicobacter sp. 13S00477-4]
MDQILKQAKKIAIIGLSPDMSKDSYIVGKYLQEMGYIILPIYPKEEFILGEKVYRDIKEALDVHKPEIVVVFRKSEACQSIAQDVLCANFLPKIFWMQLGIYNQIAKDMLMSRDIFVIENKCIKIEHQKILGEKND